MKELFFTLLALSIPLVALFALVYLFARGLYAVYADWRLGQEMEQLRRETAARRQLTPSEDRLSATPISDSLLAEGRKVESPGIYTIPLEQPLVLPPMPAAPKMAEPADDEGPL